jgi:hypothetical protein
MAFVFAALWALISFGYGFGHQPTGVAPSHPVYSGIHHGGGFTHRMDSGTGGPT